MAKFFLMVAWLALAISSQATEAMVNTLKQVFPQAEVSETSESNYHVRLVADSGTVMLSASIGALTLDLNGHSITGSTEEAAIRMDGAEGASAGSTQLTLKGPGRVVGGAGLRATNEEEASPGGAGISVGGDVAEIVLSIGAGVTVAGGHGGDAIGRLKTAAAVGGCAIASAAGRLVVTNAGEIVGGPGGNYVGTFYDGVGGTGAAAIFCDGGPLSLDNTGVLRGGAGGYGFAAAGNAGAAVAASSDAMIANDGEILGGEGGMAWPYPGKGADALAVGGSADVTGAGPVTAGQMGRYDILTPLRTAFSSSRILSDGEGGYLVKLAGDIGPVVLADNLGPVKIDLNGHSITGAVGQTEKDGGAAVTFIAGEGFGLGSTEVAFTGPGSIVGGRGANQQLDVDLMETSTDQGMAGGPAFATQNDVVNCVSVTLGADVSAIGGAGGDAFSGSDVGSGGPVGAGLVVLSGEGTTAKGPRGVVGFDDLLRAQFPSAVIARTGDGYHVTLREISGPVTLCDSMGNVVIDLNGKAIRSADGSAFADAAPAVRIRWFEYPGLGPTRLTFTGGGLVQGGDGADGTPNREPTGGGAAVAVRRDVQGGLSVTADAGVTLRGGDGGADESGARTASGGKAVTLGVARLGAGAFIDGRGGERDLTEMIEAFVPVSATVECVAGDGHRVTLTEDLEGPLELPDNLGKLTLDLNGHSIRGTAGGAEYDGDAAIIFMTTYETLLGPTELVLVGPGLVAGGDGCNGTESRAPTSGGPAVCADFCWDVAAVSVTVGAGVTLRGGKGGDGVRGDEFGYGGTAVDEGVTLVENGGAVVDGVNGAFDLGDALAAAFPASSGIVRQPDGGCRVTLMEDVYGVTLRENYGRVTVDLNGHAIRGAAGTADSSAKPGLMITSTGVNATPLDLTLVGPGEVCGGDGDDYFCDGTEAIVSECCHSLSITVGEGVTVRGGAGASFVEDHSEGGWGQCGLALDGYGRLRIVNAGTIAGGRGGDVLGEGGQGGFGASAICCWGDAGGDGWYGQSLVVTNLASGVLRGGDGGRGAWGGDSGRGFRATDFGNVVFVNEGRVAGGAGGAGRSKGGAALQAIQIRKATALDFTNAGRVDGGDGGAGGTTGGNAYEVADFSAVGELGFTNTGTMTAGSGGDGDTMAGTAADPAIGKDVANEIRSETEQGTITPGRDGHALEPPLARFARLFGGCAEVARSLNGNWHATLTNDVVGLELPEDAGMVRIDLNGHAVRGAAGAAAITVTAVDGNETPLMLVLQGPGSVIGGDGTAEGRGGEGISTERGVDGLWLKVGADVTVQGGKGWNISDDSSTNAGDGGPGVCADGCRNAFTLLNAGTVAGGDGGDYLGANPAFRGGWGGDGLSVHGGDGDSSAWGTTKVVNNPTGVIRSGEGGSCRAGRGGCGSAIWIEAFEGGVELVNQGMIRSGGEDPIASLPDAGYEGVSTVVLRDCGTVTISNGGDIIGASGGPGGIWGGEVSAVVSAGQSERVDFDNSGRIIGGRAGDGGLYGGEGSSAVTFFSITDLSFTNTGTIKGVDGGDGGLSGGDVCEAIDRSGITNTIRYDTARGTVVEGVPGQGGGACETSALLAELFLGAEISADGDGGWRVRLTGDLQGVVLPSSVGAVTIDLNGHAIRGEGWGSAITVISMDADADSLTLSLVGPGLVAGGDGDNDTWDGGAGVFIDWGMESMTVNVGENVTVRGGCGWNSSGEPEAWSGGYGGSGIYQNCCMGSFTLVNAGTIVGGDGGDCLGAGEYERNGGSGASGFEVYGTSSASPWMAPGISEIVNLASGVIRSGNGGNGRGQGGSANSAIRVDSVEQVDIANHGQIVCGRAGDGGAAGGEVWDSIVFDNVGNVVEDATAGGTVVEGVPGGVNVSFRSLPLLAALIPGAETALTDDGGCRVKLTADLVGLELPENIGPVTIDLNGHAIRGNAGGHAITITTVGANESPLALALVGPGTVVGGDGTLEDDGGSGVFVGDGVAAFSLRVGEGVTVQGGNGRAGDESGGGVRPAVAVGRTTKIEFDNAGRIVGGRAGDGRLHGGDGVPCIRIDSVTDLVFANTGFIRGCDGGNGGLAGGAAAVTVEVNGSAYEVEGGTVVDGVDGVRDRSLIAATVSDLFPGAEIAADEDGGWTMRLTNDLSTVVLPDWLGAVTIDLNGRTIRGEAGCEAIRVAATGEADGNFALSLAGPGSIVGGDGTAELGSGCGIVLESGLEACAIDVGEGVTVRGGNGWGASGDPAVSDGGSGAPGVWQDGYTGVFTLANAGTIAGGDGGDGAVSGGFADAALCLCDAMQMRIVNSGRIVGGRAGDGGLFGGEAASCVSFAAVDELSFVNTGTIKGGDGGDGMASGGPAAEETVFLADVGDVVQYETAGGTMTVGTPGTVDQAKLSKALALLFPEDEVSPDGNGGWVVRLTADRETAVLADSMGPITIDLDGHTIRPVWNEDAITICHGEGGSPLVLNLVGPGAVIGGDGDYGLDAWSDKNASDAIQVEDDVVAATIAVGAGVTVRGGKGGDCADADIGGQGGKGGKGGKGVNTTAEQTGVIVTGVVEDGADGGLPGISVASDGQGGCVVTLTANVETLTLPDNLGEVVINLNGHIIYSATPGKAALTISDGGAGPATKLTLLGPGSVRGRNGNSLYASTYDPLVLDGTAAIQVPRWSSACLAALTIGEGVQVKGGDGGRFSQSISSSANAHGGYAAPAIDYAQPCTVDFTLVNAGAVQGGCGGVYGGTYAFGAGANGAIGLYLALSAGTQMTVTNAAAGVIAGGAGGDVVRYRSTSGTFYLGNKPGTGGAAINVARTDSTCALELVNAGRILGGDGGSIAKLEVATGAGGGVALVPADVGGNWASVQNTGTIADGRAGRIDRAAAIEEALLGGGFASSDVSWDEANGRAVVTLSRDYSQIKIPDNVGEVLIDFNGYWITGYSSSNPAITITHPSSSVATPTHLILTGTGGVAGVNGGSKNSSPAGDGGTAISRSHATPTVTINIAPETTVRGGNGGNSPVSPGSGAPAIGGGGVVVTGTVIDGVDGQRISGSVPAATDPLLTLHKLFPRATIVRNPEGGVTVTLTADSGAVSVPDNLGPVTLDLNGHSIMAKGTGETALNFSSQMPKDQMTDLTIVGRGTIAGSNGEAGRVSYNGADGIYLGREGVSVTVGPEVTVRGGNGDLCTIWRCGGHGGCGIRVGTSNVCITVYGTVVGGDGGVGDSGLGGDGGAGVKVASYANEQYEGKLVNEGRIVAGRGGDGCLPAGCGGKALLYLDNYEVVGTGETQDGVDGESPFPELFHARYPSVEVSKMDDYSMLLTLTEDLHDTLVISMSEWLTGHELPRNYHSIFLDLNGHSIYGVDGTAEHPDAGPGIHCPDDPNGNETWLYVEDFTASSNSVVRGGNGYSMASDGPAGKGGDGILSQYRQNCIQFFCVDVFGGDGGDNTGGGDGGDGGYAIRGELNALPVNIVLRGGDGGDAVSGDGGTGGDALGDYGNDWDCEFPGGNIWLYGGNGGNSRTGNGGDGGHGQHFDLYDGYNVPYMDWGAVHYFGGNGGSSVDGDGGDGGHGLWGYGCEWTMGTELHGGNGGASVNGNGGSGGDGLRGDGATLGTSWGGQTYYDVDEIPHEAVGGAGGESDRGMGGNGGNGVTYVVVGDVDAYTRWFGDLHENIWESLQNATTYHLALDSTGGAGADGFFRGIGGSSVVFGDDLHQGGDEVNITAGASDNGPDGRGKAWEFTVTGPGVLDWQNLIDDPWIANFAIGETNAYLTVSIDGGEPLTLRENDTAGELLPERLVFGGEMDTVHTVAVRFHTSTTRIAPTRPSGSVTGWTFTPYGIDIHAPVTHPESEPFTLANLGTAPAAETVGKTILNAARLDTTANLDANGRQLDATVNPAPTNAPTSGTMDYWYVARNPRSPDDPADTLAMTAPTLSACEPTSFTVGGIEGLSEFSWEMLLREGGGASLTNGSLALTVVKTLDGVKTTNTYAYTAAELQNAWKGETFRFDGPTNALYDVTFTYTNNSDGDGQALVDNIRWSPRGAALMIVDHDDPGDGSVYLAFRPQFPRRSVHPTDVSTWMRNRGLRAKRGATRAAMETFAPQGVQLSDRPAHTAATDRVWVKVPLAGLDQNCGFWRVSVDDAELSYLDADGTPVDPPDIRSGPAEEDARSVNVFGIVKVSSAATNTLVAIPWTWYSAQERNAADIPVDKLVKPTNLTEGDQLLLYRRDDAHGDHYEGWILEGGEWIPITTVTSNAVYQAVSGMDGAVAVRGYGLWLVRQRPVYTEGPDKGRAVPFWLYGQSVIRQEVSRAYGGTRTKPTYTMMGNPYCEPVRINDLVFAGDIGRDDRIIVPNGANASKYLEYKEEKGWRWARPTESGDALQNTYDYDVSVPAGTGFWYVRRTAGDLTVTWPMPQED